MNTISPDLNIMIKASEKASKVLIRDFGEIEKLQVSVKGPSDFVSNADTRSENEIKNDFSYDCVVMARFDLGQRGKEYSQKYYATNFNFNEMLDMSYIYSAFWDQLNHGFADHWFFSNSKNMDVVSSLHDNLLDYYSPSSKYVKNVTTGWPDSDSCNDFSNEFFNQGSLLNKKIWPLNACIDNHKLYKWHFINTGLYKVCKFIDITEDR